MKTPESGLPPAELAKLPIPQINPETKLSQDYPNEFSWAFVGEGMLAPEKLAAIFKTTVEKQAQKNGGRVMRHYGEHFSSNAYESALDEKTTAAVAELDSIADQVNALYADGQLTREKMLELTKRAAVIIYGSSLPAGYR